jgi:hypothetical protein
MSQQPVFIVQVEGANLRVVCADLAEALEQAEALSRQYQRRVIVQQQDDLLATVEPLPDKA